MNAKSSLLLVAATLALAACAYAPEEPAPPPAQPVNLARVYFYPAQGQTPAQQDRDRYDCHVWSVEQTGFDPTRRIGPRETRATVVPAPSPLESVATGAVVGAALGAVVAGHGDRTEGALVGALAGSVVGSAAASAAPARAADTRYNTRGTGRHEREAAGYRRAMSACLEGRGYSVR